MMNRTERVARWLLNEYGNPDGDPPHYTEATELLTIIDGNEGPVNIERLAIAINYAGISPRQASEVRKKLSYDGTGTLADVRAAWNLPNGHVMKILDVTKNEYRDAARAILAYAQENNDE